LAWVLPIKLRGVKMEDNVKPRAILDCIGLYCPEPLFQTREQMDKLEDGDILEVLADDPAAEEDLKRFVKRTGNELIKFEKSGAVNRFLLKKRS
jgi:TusA-related sulfurtransferase